MLTVFTIFFQQLYLHFSVCFCFFKGGHLCFEMKLFICKSQYFQSDLTEQTDGERHVCSQSSHHASSCSVCLFVTLFHSKVYFFLTFLRCNSLTLHAFFLSLLPSLFSPFLSHFCSHFLIFAHLHHSPSPKLTIHFTVCPL